MAANIYQRCTSLLHGENLSDSILDGAPFTADRCGAMFMSDTPSGYPASETWTDFDIDAINTFQIDTDPYLWPSLSSALGQLDEVNNRLISVNLLV